MGFQGGLSGWAFRVGFQGGLSGWAFRFQEGPYSKVGTYLNKYGICMSEPVKLCHAC